MTIYKMLLKVCLVQLVVLTFSGSALAYINNQIDQSGIVIQCPENVKCDSGPNGLVCVGLGDNAKYWALNTKAKDIAKGNYAFSGAVVIEHSEKISFDRPVSSMLFCSYKYADSFPFPVGTLVLKPKAGDHFFPIMNSQQSSTGWSEDKWQVGPSITKELPNRSQSCGSLDAASCPFREAPAIAIASYVANKDYSFSDDLTLEVFANQKQITADFMSANEFKITGNDAREKFSYFSYDTLMGACGSVKQCVIYIKNPNDISDSYASVTIDFTNGMKIIDVKSPNGGMNGSGRHHATFTAMKHPLYETVMMIGNG